MVVTWPSARTIRAVFSTSVPPPTVSQCSEYVMVCPTAPLWKMNTSVIQYYAEGCLNVKVDNAFSSPRSVMETHNVLVEMMRASVTFMNAQ